MDRSLVYPGSIPLDTDVLGIQRNTMVAMGYLLQATFGTGTLVDGLACTPTSPATLRVNVSSGSIIALATVDATAYGSIPADTTDALVKMGINTGPTSFTLTAPGTSGQSQNYLIEVSFTEQDGSPVVLPYFNAANPTQAFSGPNNSGAPQNTKRTQTVGIQLKAGAPAVAGSQVTPAVDAGWTGLYIITINFGQTQVTETSITRFPGAAFIGTKLTGFRQRLTDDLTLYVSQISGNDANGGLVPWSAKQTLQGAWGAIINNFDLNGFNVTVNVAAGTYTQGLAASGQVPGQGQGNSINFIGNLASPSSVLVSTTNTHAISVANGASINVAGMKLVAGGAGPAFAPPGGLVAGTSGNITVTGAMEFGNVTGYQIWATESATVAFGVAYTISGGGLAHWSSAGNGQVLGASVTVRLVGTPSFSTGFAVAFTMGLVQPLLITFSGASSGPRYAASTNGVVNTNGSGATYLPGSVAGSTSFGGQYV